MIKVLINGACGRMGCEVEKLVDAAEDMKAAAMGKATGPAKAAAIREIKRQCTPPLSY